MRLRLQVASSVVTLLCVLAVAGTGRAADQKAILDKVTGHYQAAVAAYDDGEFEKTKSELVEAIALAKDNGLASRKIVAQSYLLFGVLEVAGLKEREVGIGYFAKALDISPAIQVPPSMATKAVLAAFERAENQNTAAVESATKEPAETEAPPRSKAKPEPKSDPIPSDQEAEKPASGGERKRAEAERKDGDKRSRDDRERLVDDLAQAKVGQSMADAEQAKLQKVIQEKDKQLAEAQERLQQANKDKQDQEKQLGETKTRLQQLEKERADRDKQLADSKGRLQQLGKEKQDTDRQVTETRDAGRKETEAKEKAEKAKLESDRQLADAKARAQQLTRDKQDTDKQLGDTRESLRKEREADDRLGKAKLESDRQLADSKARLQQLTRDKQESDQQLAATQKQLADTEKQLAASKEGEKKEHEARDKVERSRQEDAARDKDRKNREEQARAEREKLIEGPDLPSHFSEPVLCTIPDEIPAGADLFVHCLPHPNASAKVVAFYYRGGGSLLYNATTMERSKKGWYTTVVPGNRVTGRLLQYYVEARDAKQAVAASNGRASSPNIATIRPAATRGH
jgi:hypothetical protein